MADPEDKNPLLLTWVKEWLDQARERNTKGVNAYKKAYDSLKACPITFNHPSELKQLRGFGDKLCERLTEKMNKHCQENGLPIPKRARGAARRLDDASKDENAEEEASRQKTQRKPKQYVPKLRSGAYAIILALGNLPEDNRSGLNQAELIEAAQPHCDASFTAPKRANEFYTAWNSMKTLETKELVQARGRPIKRYLLTDEGWEVAKRLKSAVETRPLPAQDASASPVRPIVPPSPQPCQQPLRQSNGTINSESSSTKLCTKPNNIAKKPKKTYTTLLDSDIEDFGDSPNGIDDDIIEIEPPVIRKQGQVRPALREESSLPQKRVNPTTNRSNCPPDSETASPNKTSAPIAAAQSAQTSGVNPITIPPGTFTFHLVLDSREVRSKRDRDYMQTELSKRGIETITRPLPLGDFTWIAKLRDAALLPSRGDMGDEVVLDYIVERKRLDDLISSIRDSRFREQKFRLGRSGIRNVVYLVEEMNLDSDVWGRNEAAVQTALASTQTMDGFFVKRTQSTDDTIRYVARMTEALRRRYEGRSLCVLPGADITGRTFLPLLREMRENEVDPGKGYYLSYHSFESLCSKSDALTLRDVFLKMLMCTRGVTGEKALEIQAKWKTPREFVEAFERCGGGEAGRKRKRELVFEEMTDMVGRKKVGKALSKGIAEVWADDV